ncbi:MAG: anti-sigma factor family protein [Bryobacteraceae bacterium]
MTCHSARELMQPFLDEELDTARRSDLEHHLQSCVECAGILQGLSELRTTIRAGAPYYAAPEGLEGRVKKALRQSVVTDTRTSARWGWAAAAASLGIAAAMLVTVFVVRPQRSAQDLLAQEVVSSHVRSLMANHLMDVPSSDQHTVKPWFAGKLDFSPQVKDLAPQGYRLIGGRLDYMDKRPVAALVFQRHQHVINLFVWPSATQPGGRAELARSGFNLVHWKESGLFYCAISDLNAAELREFARLYSE